MDRKKTEITPHEWLLSPSKGAGNSNTATRKCLLDRLREAFPDALFASLTGDRASTGDAWMAYLAALKIRFILCPRENQRGIREGYETWTMTDIAKCLAQGQKMIVKGWCHLGQEASRQSPAVRSAVLPLPADALLALVCSGNPRRALAAHRDRWKIDPSTTLRASRAFDALPSG